MEPTKCDICGSIATRECGFTSNEVCTIPLCDNHTHEHTIIDPRVIDLDTLNGKAYKTILIYEIQDLISQQDIIGNQVKLKLMKLVDTLYNNK